MFSTVSIIQEMSKRESLYAACLVVTLGWLFICLVQPADRRGVFGTIAVGSVVGTIFGHASLAGRWCALGPLALAHRLPLSGAWLAALLISLGCNIAGSPSPEGLEVLLIYGAVLVGQWLLVQAPMWFFVRRYGLRIAHQDDLPSDIDERVHQFGIRQVMILTALVGIVLGLGRLLLGGLNASGSFGDWRGILLFAFLAFANAVTALPIVALTMLRRSVLAAIGGALALIALMTVLELPVVAMLGPGPMNAREYSIFTLISSFECVWIVAVLLILRGGGYRLTSRVGAPTHA
jgi:hypothetical protein